MIKYIFCISPGRSGSKYLAAVFNCVDNVRAFHEPAPVLNGAPMKEFLKGNSTPMEKLMGNKVRCIKENLSEKGTYVETNHLFIKGFGWFLPSRLNQNEIGVIELRRDPEQVISSMLRIQSTPLIPSQMNWMMTPRMIHPEIKLSFIEPLRYSFFIFLARFFRSRYNRHTLNLRLPKWIINYERKLLHWYIEETFAQGEKYRKAFPLIKYYKTNIDQLNNPEEVEKMFDFFGLEKNYSIDISTILGTYINEKKHFG